MRALEKPSPFVRPQSLPDIVVEQRLPRPTRLLSSGLRYRVFLCLSHLHSSRSCRCFPYRLLRRSFCRHRPLRCRLLRCLLYYSFLHRRARFPSPAYGLRCGLLSGCLVGLPRRRLSHCLRGIPPSSPTSAGSEVVAHRTRSFKLPHAKFLCHGTPETVQSPALKPLRSSRESAGRPSFGSQIREEGDHISC